MIWVLIPRAAGSQQRIPKGRDKWRCAFKLTTVGINEGLKVEGPVQKICRSQGRDGNSLDQGAGQYPEHAGLQGGKHI